MPELVLEAGHSFEQQGLEPASPSSSPTRATIDPDGGTVERKLEKYQRLGLIWLRLIKGDCGWLQYGHSFKRLHLVLRHRQGDHMNHVEEVLEEGKGFL